MITKMYSILPPSLIDYNFKRRGTKKKHMPNFNGKFGGNRQLLGGERHKRKNYMEQDLKRNKVRQFIHFKRQVIVWFLYISIQSQQEIL
jgi:hypothetical protein